ncbi:prepilin-type N-terminal cleavage/methylation domain-containing protein [Candidatus Parcubacteria bacterium]|nr:prepilin-type N-terminal cleavage/methylation domain-containing protein [Patescibacteria group bacterium]MBU4309271.1 prepilin-type N-terminal cleavage/methylation domain-containing protein [Patescibacteria group bacterium]MBU4432500.1 prepilin-type N-terminal cleavage/methylation domain-containing protein [Patescibacteria group bacterium]MBU4577632.1 prepilin-type N-terminal cleavage/methylation domain-containing protein [Patescibacteria group bacterium]MCG2697318.1 prepilin-type N-terminal
MNFSHEQSGFSLMEIMVTIAIIGILSAVTIVNYASIGKKNSVSLAAQNLSSDIHKTQSYALNGKIVGTNKGYWGVYFDKDNNGKYIIFADNDQDNLRDSGDTDYQVVNLPKGVKIMDVHPSAQISLVYAPPDPKIAINPGAVSSAMIGLSNYDDTNTKVIEVNIFGLVDVD